MRCLIRSIGCLVLIVLLLLGVLFYYRDRIPFLRGRLSGRAVPTAGVVWEPLTPAGAARARAQVAGLGQRSGPVFASIRAGDVASYVFEELSKQLPPSADSAEAAVIDDKLYVRASMRLSDIGRDALGPFAGSFGDRERVEFGGRLDVLRPGLAQYHMATIKIRDFSVPPPLIPKLVPRIGRGSRPEGLAADALPLVVPRSIADVRVANGRVTLYKATPEAPEAPATTPAAAPRRRTP